LQKLFLAFRKQMRKQHRRFPLATVPISILLLVLLVSSVICGSTLQNPTLTPMQIAIEEQRQRLNSGEIEDRREALMRLRALQRSEASRVALSALNDPAPIVRATAAGAVLWLPAAESAAGLIPLLNDKEEFVRQQAAYALGQTRSRSGIAPLIERLTDKKDSVRGAAAVALGQIGDATAVTSLAALLNPQAGLTPGKKGQNTKREKNLFVLRAAARALGQIGNRAGVPALILALQDELATDDLRREAASALGAIGDASAIPALRVAETAGDPYLAEAAHQALRRISRSTTTGGI
jgi:HEAT repeat protein